MKIRNLQVFFDERLNSHFSKHINIVSNPKILNIMNKLHRISIYAHPTLDVMEYDKTKLKT